MLGSSILIFVANVYTLSVSTLQLHSTSNGDYSSVEASTHQKPLEVAYSTSSNLGPILLIILLLPVI